MSDELDLGSKSPEPMAPVTEEGPKVSYPSFTLRGAAAEAFKKKYGPCNVGDDYEAGVRLHISGISERDGQECCIDFETRAIIGDVVESEEEGDTKEKEEAEGKKPSVVKNLSKERKGY